MNKWVMSGVVLAGASVATQAAAQNGGPDQYIAVIFATGNNFCPRNTAPASGQIIAIQTNTALFSLLGTTYGGDGRTNFALPNLNSRAPVGQGQGPGLNYMSQGQQAGVEQVTIQPSQMPIHTHGSPRVSVRAQGGDTNSPTGASLASGSNKIFINPLGTSSSHLTDNTFARSGEVVVVPAGGNQPMPILEPYQAVTYCIVTQGIFPPRN